MQNVVEFQCGGVATSLRVVHHYIHLGSMCVVTGVMDMETRRGAAASVRGLVEAKAIFKLGLGRKVDVMFFCLFFRGFSIMLTLGLC